MNNPTKKTNYRIALIPGDGIGHEVVPAAAQVLEKVGSRFGFTFDWTEFDWSCERFTKTGAMMPDDGVDQLRAFDGVFLGAVGFPGVEDHISLWGLLIPIRRAFDQYANVRPLKLFEGVQSPLIGRSAGDIDMVIVRENAEGEYSEMGGRIYAGTDREMVVQESVFSRFGVDRIIRHAFELATKRAAERGRPGRVTSATKSNGIIHTMPFWDERFELMAAEYPDIVTDKFHIDILCAHFVQHPDWFDVVVGSNLFGDILSDLG
ncbi:MAG: tartrate dehydrogenase, partial [Rhodospirillaceae bacterium]|nr:tartrate dehydrogenase [Rhodospirillaceae bacterium]